MFSLAKEQDIEDALIFLKKSLAESEAACVKYKESLEKAHVRVKIVYLIHEPHLIPLFVASVFVYRSEWFRWRQTRWMQSL